MSYLETVRQEFIKNWAFSRALGEKFEKKITRNLGITRLKLSYF